MSETGLSCHAKLPETATCEAPADRGMPTAPRLSLSPCSKSHSEDLTDSPVTLLCCESLGSLSDVEASVDVAAFQAALGQTFNLVPVEVVSDEPTGCFLDESGPNEGEHISVYEHSYCRPDTDRDQLWNKILSLHAKILELGRREESTVAKIQALESEIALLKRDGAVFKEKQKVLEDYISSVLLWFVPHCHLYVICYRSGTFPDMLLNAPAEAELYICVWFCIIWCTQLTLWFSLTSTRWQCWTIFIVSDSLQHWFCLTWREAKQNRFYCEGFSVLGCDSCHIPTY